MIERERHRLPTMRVGARTLRHQGYTYSEIRSRLGVIPKGTLAYWLKDIRLNPQQRRRIRTKIITSAARGRPLARAAWERKIQVWRHTIEARVKPLGFLPYTNSAIGKLVCGVM